MFEENVPVFWAGPGNVKGEDGDLYDSKGTKIAFALGEKIQRKFPLSDRYNKDTPKHLLTYITKFGDRARHWSEVYYTKAGHLLYKTLSE